MDSTPSRGRPWVAALLALLCSGLGHVYAGRVLAGVAIQVLWLAGTAGLILALRHGVGPTAAAGAAVLGLWIAQAALAARATRALGEARRGWLSRPLGLLRRPSSSGLSAGKGTHLLAFQYAGRMLSWHRLASS